MDEKRKEIYDEKGTGDVLGDIKKLEITAAEKVEDLAYRIQYEYECNAGSYGTLTVSEAQERYDLLLEKLPKIPELKQSDVQRLTSLIKEKVIKAYEFKLERINSFLK